MTAREKMQEVGEGRPCESLLGDGEMLYRSHGQVRVICHCSAVEPRLGPNVRSEQDCDREPKRVLCHQQV